MNQHNEHSLSFQYEALLRLAIQLHISGELITVAKVFNHPQALYTERNAIDAAFRTMAKRGFLIEEMVEREDKPDKYQKIVIPTVQGQEFLLRRDEIRRELIEIVKYGEEPKRNLYAFTEWDRGETKVTNL